MPKRRIPDPLTITYCETCGRAENGKGYYGPGCMCAFEARPKVTGPSHGGGVGSSGVGGPLSS